MKHLIIALALLVPGAAALAQDSVGAFQEGTHYRIIDPPLNNVRVVDGVRVTEVFSYLCNHCATFEPYMQSWKGRMPEGVELTRIPVEFGRAIWGLYARAYITADLLGVAEEAHVAMMDTLWKERRQMRSMEEIADFYSAYGVPVEKFLATSKSFAVDMRMKNEQKMVQAAGVSGTPSMLVNGKYLVSAGGAVSGFEILLQVVDALVAHEQAAQTAANAPAEAAPEKALAAGE